MKKQILTSLAMLSVLAACNDDYNDKFDIQNSITDVKNITMTLKQSDYAQIAGNAKNLELALAKDPEGKTGVTALANVGENGYFTSEAPADEYLPAFLDGKYPNADLKSKFTVIYNQYQAPSTYLKDFTNVSGYVFGKDDYKKVWGDRVEALYLSPSTLAKIPSILGEKVTGATDGDMVAVEYAYSATEPSIGGGGQEQMVYKEVSSIDAEGGNYVLLAPDKDGKMIPFGRLKDKDEDRGYGYMVGEPMEVADGFIMADPSGHVIKLAPAKNSAYTMQRVADDKYIYLKGTFNSYNLAASLPEGVYPNWSFKFAADGMASVVNATNLYTVKLNFYADGNSYSFGAYPASKTGVFMNESCLNGSDGGFIVKNVSLSEGLSRIWKIDGTYGWKASAHVGNADLAGESWIVSQEIDLTGAKNPVLTADLALNFLNNNNRADFINLKISEDYKDDVTKATWTDLNVPNWPAGNKWDFNPSGDVDLSAYIGKKVRIAFAYKSTDKCAPTFEVKNIKVIGEPAGYYADVKIYKEMPASEADAPAAVMSVATRAAAVSANATALYRFADNAWKMYENKDAQIAVVEPDVYASIQADSIEEPEQVLPAYLNNKYPYALDAARAAVVYKSSEDEYSVKEFTKKAGIWIPTPDYVEEQIILNKDVDGISAKISVFIDESLLGNDGGFTVQDVSLTGVSYVWTNTANYGWKGAAFNTQCNAAESWLVSPAFDFRKATAPIFTYDEAINKLGPNATVADHCFVLISTDYKGDVTKAQWTALKIPTRPAGSDWNFVNVGVIDLSAYVGNRVHIAYKYVSTSESAPTWEFKNILIKEKDAE